jgi:putative membrane protein
MSARAFFGDEAKSGVRQTIERLELECSAEVVVSVAPASGDYRAADYLWGALAAMGITLVFVFHPHPFDSTFFPLELGVAFVAASAVSAFLLPLRRWLTPSSRMKKSVLSAAKAKFVDLGVSGTRARSGLLVYVSMFERKVAIISDIGIDRAAHAQSFDQAERLLGLAVRRGDLGAFTAALAGLGPLLIQLCPPRHDDVNELPDEPVVA